GAGSEPAPRVQLFFTEGSASQVTVTVGVAVVLSIVFTTPFQVPNTALGAYAVPPHCQSPLRPFGSVVMSVMNSMGDIGRPDTSVLPSAMRVLWSMLAV